MTLIGRPLEQRDIGELSHRMVALEERMANVQALMARTRDDLRGEANVVDEIRKSESYASAYADEPLISVRVATYRGADVLARRSLPSLLAQTYDRWEAVVVGDATDDSTAEVIAALGDSRIRFENLPVRGPYPADPRDRWYVAGTGPVNRAIETSKGSWIAGLDHDDEWTPDHLETLLRGARNTHAEVVYGKIEVRESESGHMLGMMGAWPPVRGEFGFLGALVHAGLKPMRFDKYAFLADEPGDWNLARRLWDAGARFAFVDHKVAIHHAAGRGAHESPDARTISELRVWVEELDALRNRQVDELEKARDAALEELARVQKVLTELERTAQARTRPRWRLFARGLKGRHRRGPGS